MALISDTKQAMSEDESGPVETGLTGLTGPVATALKRTTISSKKSCPKCHGMFTRLDTHLKNNAFCKVHSSV